MDTDSGTAADTLTMQDRSSGRPVTIRRPLAQYLSPARLVDLDEVVRTWGNLATEDQAERTLDLTADGRPERVLYGLLWLAGVWCGLCHARTGIDLDDVIGGLDYRGPRRELSGMDDQQWDTGTQIVRRGVTVVVHSDADVAEYLRIVSSIDPSLVRTRRHLLTILDGLGQDMERNDLAPWGAVGHIVTGAGWLEDSEPV